jgi:hypothetical protein
MSQVAEAVVIDIEVINADCAPVVMIAPPTEPVVPNVNVGVGVGIPVVIELRQSSSGLGLGPRHRVGI